MEPNGSHQLLEVLCLLPVPPFVWKGSVRRSPARGEGLLRQRSRISHHHVWSDGLTPEGVAILALLVMSRYYWSVACLFFLLGGRDRDGPWEGLVAGGLLLVVAGFYLLSPGIETSFGQYHRANLLLTLWAVPALAWRAFVLPK